MTIKIFLVEETISPDPGAPRNPVPKLHILDLGKVAHWSKKHHFEAEVASHPTHASPHRPRLRKPPPHPLTLLGIFLREGTEHNTT